MKWSFRETTEEAAAMASSLNFVLLRLPGSLSAQCYGTPHKVMEKPKSQGEATAQAWGVGLRSHPRGQPELRNNPTWDAKPLQWWAKIPRNSPRTQPSLSKSPFFWKGSYPNCWGFQ